MPARGTQLAELATRYKMPTTHSAFEMVEAGRLMSYGSDLRDMARQVGIYASKIRSVTRRSRSQMR